MAGPSILVVGGAGYIGSRTCRALSEAGYLPVTFDNFSRGHRAFVRWGPLEEGDVLDRGRLAAAVARHRPAACVHFAAFSFVGESVADPAMYYRNNVVGSLNVAEALLAGGCDKIVFSSTCATYGEPARVPIDEDTPQIPVNPYGRSKLMVEQILRDLRPAAGLRSIFLRYFNACGAHEDGAVGEAHEPEPHLIPRAIMAALGQIDHLDILGTDYPSRDGTAIRDYIHITDLAAAHVLAIRRLLDGGDTDAFNLGIGTGYTVREVVRSVERVGGKPVPVREAPRRAGDPPELVADPAKARRVLGFEPIYTDLDRIVATAWRWHAQRQAA
ncbi:UDP-glucose 4-epimerase GalE [Propylenella binzhouense]|uniref:UDP-glucose 4-epimerase n=1 Tax=Propylenella binzhouense TaxID=2555902 RepID=A0A964T4K9_9HYPH|nr:UDP-glucose 4-epimerase GalE [Propylenella binzhouense]MYZ48401.1 UDP-glucose 4-epimerase GalE [Propylenella binzhouense]